MPPVRITLDKQIHQVGVNDYQANVRQFDIFISPTKAVMFYELVLSGKLHGYL